jgi:glucokinase
MLMVGAPPESSFGSAPQRAVDASGPTLLADIGATYARFVVLDRGALQPPTRLNVRDFATPERAIRAFIDAQPADVRPRRAVLAAAGPLVGRQIVMTNAGWTVDADTLRDEFRFASVTLLNDFAALAWSLPALSSADLRYIGPEIAADGPVRAVIGPGTGFGVAALAQGEAEEVVLVTEGGHATLSTDTPRQDAIGGILRRKFGHVSIERGLCGKGLADLCQAVAAVDGLDKATYEAPEIVERARGGGCALSRATLEIFCELLGSVAGNIALTLGARGGVYIAGGMVPRFVDFIVGSRFREHFEGKGRLASYLAAIPTAVIVHPQPTFLGLARIAGRVRQ